MSQPPQPPDLLGPQHDGTSRPSGGPPQERSGRRDSGKRPAPALVAVVLLVLVLLLALGAFLGVRAALGADAGGPGTSAGQLELHAQRQ